MRAARRAQEDSRFFQAALGALPVLAMLLQNPAAAAHCRVATLADLPVTMIDRHPMVTAKINGKDALFVVDSGAAYSMMTPASAVEFNLKTTSAPWGLVMAGIGGTAGGLSATTIKLFTLAGIRLRDIEFLVGGGEVGGGAAGLLGQNVLRIGDVEYDLANGAIRLIHEEDCGHANLAYWTTQTAQTYSMVEIQPTTPKLPHIAGTAIVNGVKIRVLFDTGADLSVLSLRAAQRAGVRVDSPGVVYLGAYRGIGRSGVKSWSAPFASFKLGDEEVRHTRLRIGESVLDSTDMLIGADFFLSHRVYVATKLRKLFFTYNGGPVFNMSAAVQTPQTPAAAGGEPYASAGEPKDAAEFSRRGAAFAARHDVARAIADLTRACDLAPDEPEYFYRRGAVYRQSDQPIPALADFDRAIDLNTDHLSARLARADLLLARADVQRAIEDLDAADRVAAKEADVRLSMAAAYAHADLLPRSIAQLDLWIDAHTADSRRAEALGERCRYRALSGTDLAKARSDCNAALRLTDKGGDDQARLLESRGLVRLRLGDYGRSIGDYDAALGKLPRNPWALYGRGIDKLRRGQIDEGRADLAAAAAAWPAIEGAFAKLGISP